MKALIRGAGLALLSAVLVGVSGCGADNELNGAATAVGPGGGAKPENAEAGKVAPQASSYAEYAKQQQGLSDPSKTEYSKALSKKR